ncbi:hypothetical protein BH23ACT9_BH23ACT9_21900 [soil metagenome]
MHHNGWTLLYDHTGQTITVTRPRGDGSLRVRYFRHSLVRVRPRLDTAMADSPAPYRAVAAPIAASLGLNLGVLRAELARPPRDQPDAAVVFATLLDSLVGAAKQMPTLLVIDEFPSIARVDGAAGAMRTALQHHVRDIGLIFAGSMPSVMRQLFSSRAEPFYARADLVQISPLDLTATLSIIADGFASTGRDAGLLPGHIHAFTRGHPHRTMELADACWRHTPQGDTAGDPAWAAGLREVRASADMAMPHLFDHLQPSERDVLRVVAAEGALFGRHSHLLGLGSSSAQHARDALWPTVS